jgi:polysaccharide deacetylase family protein (PEP-CTERM system associated)
MAERGEVVSHSKKVVLLSFDVEDWFQVENLRAIFPPSKWEECESRVVENTEKILNLLNKYKVKATFFVLGWIAERFPGLVKMIHSDGHEIASHGYGHILNYNLTHEEIFEDIRKSKEILESIIDEKILGYRAPNFSITEEVIDALNENGFLYDSSYHPFSKNKRYGQLGINSQKPFVLKEKLLEIPLSVWKRGKIELSIAGGGYFRLYPFSLYRKLVLSYMKDHDLLVMYFHPWEFDPDQPKVNNIPWFNKFRHYVGLRRTHLKLEKFLQESQKNGWKFLRFRDYISDGVTNT